MALGFLRDAVVLGVASPGGLYIALDLDENPITGRTSPEVAGALFRVLGISLEETGNREWKWDSADEVAREEAENLLRRPNGRAEFEAFLSYLTGFIHETRHFHDILSCCSGQDLLLQTFNLYQNALVMLIILSAELDRKGIERFPIPVRGRTDYAEVLLASGDYEQEGLQFFEKCRLLRDRVDASWVKGYPTLSCASLGSLFELSAVCAQFGFAAEIFGDMGVDTVHRVLSRKRGSRQYLEGIRLVQELHASNRREEVPGLNAVGYTTWNALQGRKPCEGSFARGPSPVVLWEHYIELLIRKRGLDAHPATLQSEFDEAASRWNLLPLEESLEAWSLVIGKRVESLASNQDAFIEGHPVARIGLQTLRDCLSVMGDLSSSIVAEPRTYHDLQVYGWTVLTGNLPSPHVVLKHDGAIRFLQFRGRPVVSDSAAKEILVWEGIFDLLVNGRGSGAIAFVEDFVFDTLRRGEYGGPPMEFWLN